jgi:hypothetical protein
MTRELALDEPDGGLTRSEVLSSRGYDVTAAQSANGTNGVSATWVCPECGEAFEGHERKLYCTVSCRSKAKARRAAERMTNGAGPPAERSVASSGSSARPTPRPVDDIVSVILGLTAAGLTVQLEHGDWRVVCCR